MTRISKTAKKRAVNDVFSLVKDGHSITSARKVIAKELDLSPTGNTLWTWQNDLKMVTPTIAKTNNLVKSNTAITRTLSGNTKNVHSISNIKTGLGDVFQSLVTKDGRFSTKEASAVSQVSSIMLNAARHELNVHKYLNKIKKSDINEVRNLLG